MHLVFSAAAHHITRTTQGRGLGGRVCTRRARVGQQTITFDHGAGSTYRVLRMTHIT
jgi:predicted NAD/FAD-dependent oxidoreductase